MPSPTQIDIFGSDWEAAPDALQLVCVMSEAGTREQVSKPIRSKRTRKQYQMFASQNGVLHPYSERRQIRHLALSKAGCQRGPGYEAENTDTLGLNQSM